MTPKSWRIYIMKYSTAIRFELNGRFLGSIAALAAAGCFSLMAFTINQVKDSYNVIEITFFRTFLLVLLIFPYLKLRQIDLSGGMSKTVMIRSVFGSLGLICNFTAFQVFTTSLASFLFSSLTLLFTVIGGIFFLGEKLSKVQSYSLLGSTIAVFIYYGAQKIPLSSDLLYSISGAAFSAAAFLSLRKAAGRYHFMLILFFLSLVSLFISSISIGYSGLQHIDWLDKDLYLIVFLAFFTQYFLTVAYRHLDAGMATFLGQSTIIWTYVLDLFFNHLESNLTQLISIVTLLLCFKLFYGNEYQKNSAA